MIIEFYEDGFSLRITMVSPFDVAIAIIAQRISHEVIFKKLTVPAFALLRDHALLDILDERAEERFPHASGERIGCPFAESR